MTDHANAPTSAKTAVMQRLAIHAAWNFASTDAIPAADACARKIVQKDAMPMAMRVAMRNVRMGAKLTEVVIARATACLAAIRMGAVSCQRIVQTVRMKMVSASAQRDAKMGVMRKARHAHA